MLLKKMLKLISTALIASFVALVPAATASDNTHAKEETNRQIVLDFYEKALNQKNLDAAMPYLGNRYTQHNPNVKDGPDGLSNYIVFLREKFPQSHSEIKRSFAEGDYVILHVHAVREPGTLGRAIIDIFKLENGKIVEHWDVAQAVPEKSENNNTMFYNN
ncbi:nuclear transport factor 2 family protein [Sulfurospirillum sp.]|uniref:nuclear transport factor 2 family protein n=1 Tax=Sulfurospirillum sp. TaxID=2053622 RepID=UPI002FDE74A2